MNINEMGVSFPYRAPLRDWLLNGGITSYGTKILIIGPFSTILGALVAILTGTTTGYLREYPYFIGNISLSVSFFVIVYGCKEIGRTFSDLDNVVGHTRDKGYKGFLAKMNNKKIWLKIGKRDLRNKHLHYASFTAFILLVAFGFGYLCVEREWLGSLWLRDSQENIILPNLMYHIFFYAVAAYIMAAAFELLLKYSFIIKAYCNRFLTGTTVKILPTQEAGGLKPLGKLALTINGGSLVPIAYVFASIYSSWQAQVYLARMHIYLVFLSAYAIALAFIFLYPLWPAHNALKEAKKNAITHVDSQLKQKYGSGIFEDPKDYEKFNTLTTSRKNLEKATTWPLDIRLSLGTATTILLPIIGGAIMEIWFEYLIKFFTP